jgi:hypothetical protein
MGRRSWRNGLRQLFLALGVLWLLALPLHHHVRSAQAAAPAMGTVPPLTG